MIRWNALPGSLVLLLAACGEQKPTVPDIAQLEQLRPSEARLAGLYERSCLLCHARAGSGAPLTGDAAGWAPRQAKGMQTLLANARQGLGAMPAMGLCADCSEADLQALINFMTTSAPTPP